jgi:O-antigen/teichoic acid export membrane protein
MAGGVAGMGDDDRRRARDTTWRLLEPVLRHGGWFGFFLFLAPIIGPQGYGLFALAISGIAIADAMLAESATAALVELDAIDDRHVSTALVSTVLSGIGMSLLLYAAASAVAAMSDDTGFGDVFQSLTILPALGGLAVVPAALLRRQRRQVPFAIGTGVGVLLGGSAALSLAMAGAGPWSLVAQIVIQRICECTVLWGMAGQRVGLAWSRAHFRQLIAALDLRALAPAWPTVTRYATCLLTGLMLGLTAAGLYLLAVRFADALADILITRPDRRACAPLSPARVGRMVRRACLAALPAVLGSALMPIVLPSLVDMRWWGAVKPAQILLLAGIPAVICSIRSQCTGQTANEARWRAVEGLSLIAVLVIAVPYGLVTAAGATLCYATIFATASLWPIRRQLGAEWRLALIAGARPLAAAVSAGGSVFILADRFAAMLDPMPLVCLLTASGWLLYLLVLEDEPDAPQPAANLRLGATRSRAGQGR